jgi:capsular polysaccharide transport system permease protein
MVDARVTYLGPPETAPKLSAGAGGSPWWRKIPVAFLLIVVLPTAIAAVYFLLIASPRYVSEARFIVRAPAQEQPSTLGIALQGAGISSGSTDSFAVHEYIRSRDALSDLSGKLDVAAVLSRPGVDVFSRYPAPGKARSQEGMFKAFEKRVSVGYESSTGISTLRVQAFTPDDAQKITQALLDGGERLINRLNERSSTRAVEDAERTVLDAETRLTAIQARLNGFRNREGIVDPESAATENAGVIGELLKTIATLRAERSQLSRQAPNSPQLPLLDGRISAYQSQLDIERRKIAGDAGSLASKVSGYESLVGERMMAERALASASSGLDAARVDVRRQKLYLERVVSPSRPDTPSQPRRLMSILAVLITTMLIYGIGWLVWAGLREHRQI